MSYRLDPTGGPDISADELADQLRDDEEMEEYVAQEAARQARIDKMRMEHFEKGRVKPHTRGGVVVTGYVRADRPASTIKLAPATSKAPSLGERIARIAGDPKNAEGFTYHEGRVQRVGKDKGFVVAAKDSPELRAKKLDSKEISSFVEEHGKGKSVGGWRDKKSGDYFLDVVEVHQDKDHALKLARERGELAIFDLSTGEEIRLDDG